jgi:tRNA A-37 threonylcarbamoyl transferase component Bud32
MVGETQHRTIGKYEVIGPLGRGAMGIVYKARDPEIGRVVAVKTLRKLLSHHLHDADAALERFRNEARSAGNLRHPNIITIFDIGRDGDTPFIVMDFVDGRSLEQILSEKKRLDAPEVIHYLRQIGAGLDYAHAKGVIHRDIKPANVLVDKSGNVFILDFGIASINDSMAPAESAGSAGLVLGTPSYMAPEQILSEKLDRRADLFACAIVAFECFTGVRPFRGENFNEVISNIVGGKGVALTAAAPDLPLALESEFQRALAREPAGRFGTAAEMVEAFAQALRLEGGAAGSGAPALSLGGASRPERGAGSAERFGGFTAASSVHRVGPVVAPVGREERITPGDLFRNPVEFNVPRATPPLARSPLRWATIGLGGCCIVLGVWLVRTLLAPRGPGPASPSVEELEDRLSVAVVGPGEVATVSPDEGAAPLVIPEFEEVSPGQAIAELTDKQLLGVIMGRSSAEGSIVEALRVALGRRIPYLADGAVVPLASDSYLVRVEALKTLVELNDRRVVPRVVLVLDDHDPVVRSQAARSLAALGDRRALGYLTARYAQEPLVDVRVVIKRAIEQLSGVPFTR